MIGIKRSEANGGNNKESESTKNIVLIKGNREEIRKTIIPLLAKALTFEAYFDHHDGIVVISNHNFDQIPSYENTLNTFFQNIQSENYTKIITSILKHITDLTQSADLVQFYKKYTESSNIKDIDPFYTRNLKKITKYLKKSRGILKTLISKIIPTASKYILNILVKHLTIDMLSTKGGKFTIESITSGTLLDIRKDRDTTRKGQMREILKVKTGNQTTFQKATLNSEKNFSFLETTVEEKYYVPWDKMDDDTQREFRRKFTLDCTSVTELKKNDQAGKFFSGFLELSKGLKPNDKKNPKNIFRKNLLCAVGKDTVQEMISMAKNFI